MKGNLSKFVEGETISSTILANHVNAIYMQPTPRKRNIVEKKEWLEIIN